MRLFRHLLIAQHVDLLPSSDQRLLEVASVEGHAFSVSAVAAGASAEEELIEARLADFSREGRLVQPFGTETWPDGTVTACYRFIHALYHEVIYQRISAGQRLRLHEQIGLRKEAGYGVQAPKIAVELSIHFEYAQNWPRAVWYRQYAVNQAIQRSAYHEAHEHLRQGFSLLTRLSDPSEQAQREFILQAIIILQAIKGRLLMATESYTDPNVLSAFTRAEELSQQVGETPERIQVLWGIAAYYLGGNRSLPTSLCGEWPALSGFERFE